MASSATPKRFIPKFKQAFLVAIKRGRSLHVRASNFQKHRKNLNIFSQALKHNVAILLSMLQASTERTSCAVGRQIHGYLLVTGVCRNGFVDAKLIEMYSICGLLEDARQVFDEMSEQKNSFVYNMMIRGYASQGPYQEAIRLYHQMRESGVQPDKFTYPFVLKACGSLLAFEEGLRVHKSVLKSGLESDIFVNNALITMYAKFGKMDVAEELFQRNLKPDPVSWNAMIAGYAQNGEPRAALETFSRMILFGLMPDRITLLSVLPAIGSLTALPHGQEIHKYVKMNTALQSDPMIITALLDMYAKCGCLDVACKLFQGMSHRSVVSWNAMIAGYAQSGLADNAISLFHEMKKSDARPNHVTFVSLLQAYGDIGALQQGKDIHDCLLENDLDSDINVSNSLISMYIKCGCLNVARGLFDKMVRRDVVSWNTMITGYGRSGRGREALDLFVEMQESGLKPDNVTFTHVLTACSHAGLVKEGMEYFEAMQKVYGIKARMDHYASIVDLLGRAGYLNDAWNFIKKMPIRPSVEVWGALLGACRIHGNIDLGVQVAEQLFTLKPESAGIYVLLSNIYAAAGRWADVARVRMVIREMGMQKTPGCSSIEVKGKVHAFFSGDRTHPQSDQVFAILQKLTGLMQEAGFVPNTAFVLHELEEEAKEQLLLTHSEKLAIAFGLINLGSEMTIRVTNNLRMCGDCHNASKMISKLVGCDIIVRDPIRFHHFSEGSCSCGDYW